MVLIKKRDNICYPFFNVNKLPNMEPFDKIILPKNILYSNLVYVLKDSTFEYFNMRIILGLDSV